MQRFALVIGFIFFTSQLENSKEANIFLVKFYSSFAATELQLAKKRRKKKTTVND